MGPRRWDINKATFAPHKDHGLVVLISFEDCCVRHEAVDPLFVVDFE